MKGYPKYKSSGVDWLGEIPDNWKLYKLKNLLQLRLKYGANEAAELDDINLPRYIRITDFGDDGKLKDTTFKSLPFELAKDYFLKEGDILFARSGATVGKTMLFEKYSGNACFAGYLIMARCHPEKILYKFLYYYTKSQSYDSWKNMIFIENTIQNIGADKYNLLLVPVPNIEEQQKIVDFLDYKTGQCDRFIANRQKQIELLNEQKAAIINKAVTKGINPNAKMKPSGIEWIGDIPAHWQITKLGYLATVKARLGWKGLTASEYVESGYIFLATPNIKNDFIDFQKVNYITPERYFESPEIMLEKDDVLLAKDGSTLGIANIVRELPAPSTVNSSIAVIRSNNSINSEFLYCWISSHYIQSFINSMKAGQGVPHLFQADIRKFLVLFPPLQEQQLILDFVKKEASKIEALISKYQKQIDLMQEYRTALISQAVTGKIDVRDWQPKTSSQPK